MSAFETQVTSENPRVLMFGEYLPFLTKIEVFFKEYQIKTWTLFDSEIRHLDSTSLDSQNTYKIIWWLDLNNEKKLFRVKDFLEKNKELPIIIIGILPESFSPLLKNDEDIEKKQKLLELIIKDFSQAQLFLVRDFFTNDFLPPLFNLALQGLDKKTLFNPQQDSFFIDLKGVIEGIKNVLFKPHNPKRIVLQGNKSENEKTLKYFSRVFSRIYNQDLELINIKTSRIEFNTEGFLKVKSSANEKEVIDFLIEDKNLLQKRINTLPHSIDKNTSRDDDEKESRRSSEAPKAAKKTIDDNIDIDDKKDKDNKKAKEPIYQSKKIENDREEAIEGEISRLFKEKRVNKKGKRIDDKVKIVKKISDKSKKNKTLFLGGVGVMILGGIILALWAILETSIFFAKRDFYNYLSQNTPQNHVKYETGFWPDFLFNQSSSYEKVLGDILIEKKTVSDLFQNFETLQNSQEKLQNNIQQYTLGVLGSEESRPVFPQEIVDLSREVDEQISIVENAIFYLYPEEGEEQKKWTTYLEDYKNKISEINQTKDFFTEIFGGNGKRTFAILLQNNLEIRPTGGFIQGFALLTFDKGMIIDSQILSTNEVDTRLPGAVSSPEEVQRYLGEKTWFMRDSNWDPDFPTTAKRVSWFIKESLNKQIDGVVAINYYVLQDIIEAIGGLEITEYQENLTGDNLLERVEFHSDDEFIQENKEKKKDYSALIYTELFKSLKEINSEKAGLLIKSLSENIENKNILISSFNEDQAKFLQKIGWNGEVISPICPQRFPQTNCVVNQVYQVETNIGLNRVNEYIDRKIQERVDFSGKNIKHTRTITYTNSAKTDGWPLGGYKLYLRLISDKSTQPKEVLINGKKLGTGLANVYLEHERKVVGFPVEILKDSTLTVQYTYETDKIISEPFSYLLFDQKQPGIEREDVSTTFYFPGKKPTLIAPQGDLTGDTLEFKSTDDNHFFVGVSLQDK
jgi:hypothetical protein